VAAAAAAVAPTAAIFATAAAGEDPHVTACSSNVSKLQQPPADPARPVCTYWFALLLLLLGASNKALDCGLV
jgi:hypothetical protein